MQEKVEDIAIEVEEISSVKKKVSVTVRAEVVRKEFKTAYKALRSSAAVAGFRKGAVPVSILRARFGARIKEDVANSLIEASYPHALSEKGIVPVVPPEIDASAEDLKEDAPFSYAMSVESAPEVKVEGYKGMELSSQLKEVTDAEVDEGLERLRQGRARYEEVDRAAREGDLVVADFEGTMDGRPIKGSKSEDYPIIIGEKSLLPGFNEALTGASKGDEREAQVGFPENYIEKNLAGKEGRFTIKVKAVKERVVPELDDGLAKDLECEDLEALRKKVASELAEEKKKEEKERLKTEILDRLIEKHPFEVPDALVNKYLGVILNRVASDMKRGIVAPGDEELSPEGLREKYRDKAVRQVREDVILDNISAAEEIKVTQEEFDDAVRHLAGLRGVSFESLKGRIEREGAVEVIKDGLKHEKVFEIIIDAASAAG